MDSQVCKLSLSNLTAWDPQGTVVAFVGAEAACFASIHGTALANLAISKPEIANWSVAVIEADEKNLSEILKILHKKRVWGIVFTFPLKTAALKILSPAPIGEDEVIGGLGSVDSTAERAGAMNIALWRPNGYWGTSTDGAAVNWTLKDVWKIDFKGRNVVVIGAGALGRAASVEALSLGCKELWMGNRTQEHAWDAIDQILPSPMMRARTHSFNLLKPSQKIPKNSVIINTLPMSVRKTDTALFDLSFFEKSSFYLDTAQTSTELLKKAESIKMPATNGLRLLAWQVQRQIEIFTGMNADFKVILSAVEQIFSKQA